LYKILEQKSLLGYKQTLNENCTLYFSPEDPHELIYSCHPADCGRIPSPGERRDPGQGRHELNQQNIHSTNFDLFIIDLINILLHSFFR